MKVRLDDTKALGAARAGNYADHVFAAITEQAATYDDPDMYTNAAAMVDWFKEHFDRETYLFVLACQALKSARPRKVIGFCASDTTRENHG